MRAAKSVDDMMLEQQAETFEKEEQALVAWSNTFLARRQMEASSLGDFADGVLLINLAEVAFGERVGHYKLRPKVLAHRMDNVSTVLDYLRERGVVLISVSPQDVVDAKKKQCINVLWNLLRRLTLRGLEMLRDGGAGGAGGAGRKKETVREAILGWANESMPDVPINDFSSSFRDGVALCHIVNNLVPGSIDVASLSSANSMENLTEALRVAEEELGIPSLLSVQDFQGASGPDETAMENYVCMLVSASQARGRNEEEVAKLREAAASAKERQEQELERLRVEAEEERLKFQAAADQMARLRAEHTEKEAGAAEVQQTLERVQAEKARLLEALEALQADSVRAHERLEAAHRHEEELLVRADAVQQRLDEAQARLQEREEELNAANAEMYRLHKEQENVLQNVRSELQMQTIAENDDATEANESDPAIDDIFRRRILEQRGYRDFVSMLRPKQGWLMKRRPGGGGKKFFGTDKKKRFFKLRGDVLHWYKADGESVEKGHANLKFYRKIDFQLPDNDPEAKFYGNSRGSIADNKLIAPDGTEEEIVMRLVPLDGVKDSQAKVMELTAVQTMVPDMQEDIISWIEEINTRVSLLNYLDGMFSKQGQTSREIVEFVVRRDATELRLENTAFDSYDAFDHFKECLIMRKGLAVNLANVALSDPSAALLAEVLERNNTVVSYVLPRNLLTSAAAVRLATALRKNSSLRTLVLDGNRIEDAGVEALAGAITGHRRLAELSLCSTGVSDAGVVALVESLQAARTRHEEREFPHVLLARNRVGDRGAAAIASLVKSDPTVRVVNLENNLVTDAGAASLAASLAESGVEELNLAGNQISSKGLAAIAEAVRRTNRRIAVEVPRNPLITAEGARSLLAEDIALSFHRMAFVKNP